jgi:hypothetical protein
MRDLPALSLYSICAFGAVGLVAGLLGLLSRRRTAGARAGPGLAPAVVGLGSLGALSAIVGRPPELGWPLLTLAGLLLLFGAARSDRLAGALGQALARARSPRWQWAALALGCPAAAAVLVLVTPRGEPKTPPIRSLPPGTAVTDRGRDVPLAEVVGADWSAEDLRDASERNLRETGLWGRVIQVGPPDWSCNCHGWVFTGGRHLVADADVERILQDNGYGPIEAPRVGDLAVYRDDCGSVCHTARVWAVGEGGEVLLESKWGWMGRYLHPPDGTTYGQDWTYYRSPRPGHKLLGPGDSPLEVVPALPSVSSTP